jgi:retinol dehydrogenase 12
LLSKGARVYIATRTEEKSQTAIEDLKKDTGKESIFFLKLDLADLSSVKVAAEEFIGKESELHTLYNNGYACVPPRWKHSPNLILVAS